MPGENLRRTGRKESVSPSKTSNGDPEPRARATMIPLPRSQQQHQQLQLQLQLQLQNQKTVKTEKNRLRLIMENRDVVVVDDAEKEHRIQTEDCYRVSRESTIPRYCDVSCNGYRYPGRKEEALDRFEKRDRGYQEDSRVLLSSSSSSSSTSSGRLGVGVESGGGGVPWCQRRPHAALPVPTALGVAAHQQQQQQQQQLGVESSADAAAAAFSPAGAAAASSSSWRCLRNTSKTCQLSTPPPPPPPPANANPRPPRIYLGNNVLVVAENKEDAMEPETKEEDERRSSTPSPEVYGRRSSSSSGKRYNEEGSSEEDSKPDVTLPGHRLPSSYRGTWPIRRDLWATQQMGFSGQQGTSTGVVHNDVASVMSFSSNCGAAVGCPLELQGDRRLGAKVDVVYNLLGMLGSTEGREDMSATLLSMSNSIDSCLVMRQSGCLPLLVQLIHAPGQDPETRERASRALHNVVHAKSDERAGRREARVLRFLEQLRDYCQALRTSLVTGQVPDDLERHPGPTIAALMKLSFDEAHRHAMCQLGGLHAVAELIEMDHMAHGSECDDPNCITVRRYAGMALTNLTFGDGNNKALLCSFREFMKALVSQLKSPSDDLRQVTASVLRNLSWRADSSSKQTLREVGAVTGLMKAAMEGRKESTLKSILSALWNLSAHCSTNKVHICAVDGALAFLVDMLSYKAPSKTLAIVENAGGILRNVSSHIAVREDYRAIVRDKGCLQVLLQQLRSPSLTVVSNACGALWNLSARCPQDQRLLWDLGAVPMLRSLVHSKHKMISMGSSAALKNLLSARPGCNNLVHLDSTARGLGLPTLPSLMARRQRALEQEIDQNLAETCDNIEPSTSPTNKDDKFSFKVDHSFLGINARALRSYQLHNNNQPGTSGGKCNGVARSESRDSMRSITSTHSDTMFERVNRHVLNGVSPTEAQMKQQSASLHAAVGFDAGITGEKVSSSEKKYTLRYKNAIPDRLKPGEPFNEIADPRCTNSTISWASAPDQESACSQMLLHSSVEDNLSSLANHSVSSNSKTGSQSSVSEEPDSSVLAKTEQLSVPTKPPTVEPATSLSLVDDLIPVKDTANMENLDQGNPLETIQMAISPTANGDGKLFSDYAETDLDQPTDYSLRYAERTLEEEEQQQHREKHHPPYYVTNDEVLHHEDTVKTYCTEGTPHAASLNTSRAASASDLQEDRIRMAARKLAAENRKKATSNRVTAEKLENTKKEPGTDMKLACTSQFLDGVVEPVDLNSLRSTLAQAAANDYDEQEKNAAPAAAKSDPAEKSRDTVRREKPDKFGKGFAAAANGVYLGGALKASNDSGYQVSDDGDEDDEDLLTACINIGMQNNRHRHSFIGNSFEKLPRAESNLARYQTSVALDQMDSTNDSSLNNLDSKGDYEEAISIETVDSEDSRILPDIRPTIDYDVSNRLDEAEQKLGNAVDDQTGNRNMRTDDQSICGVSLPVNLRSGPIGLLTETTVFNGQSGQQECLPSIEDTLNMVEDASMTEEEGNQPDDGGDRKTKIDAGPSMRRSYTKVTDSESSESIDSVEQSEHALLELCIQPGPTKKMDGIPRKATRSSQLGNLEESGLKRGYSSERPNPTKETNETDGPSERGETVASVKQEEDVYRRQRDPDAMIASLDRLTATLVQQSEAMRERDNNTMKQSIISDTWNEDSPNEVSFPSISISAPLIGSFKSDVPEEPATVTSETASTTESGHMTDSRIIQREAFRLAEAVDAEMNKQRELEATSMTSMDLDAIKPPSSMGSLLSLTASYAGPADSVETFVNRDRCYSTSLPPVQAKTISSTDMKNCRKKSLPLGVVAKRALSQGPSHPGSLENLLNECTGSHLENVKPPSLMDELPDVGDMENSMLSVASITSEVADPKEHEPHSLTGSSDPVFDLLKPVANVLSITCMRYAEAMQSSSANNSLSEYLENINPPSLFNEVCEMDESTMEPGTDTTICSDTLCIDADLKTEEVVHTFTVDKIDEGENGDTDEAATPISSEYCVTSSAESTPKKRMHKNLTPKQKRNLAKERYRTYTIAAEFVKKEEERRKHEVGGSSTNDQDKIPRGKCSPFSKLTPKQRRQEDRARFQTQVLENPFPDINGATANVKREPDIIAGEPESPERQEPTSPVKSSIPTLTKLPVCRALRKKRTDKETRERYRTRTLNESESILREAETNGASANGPKKLRSPTNNIRPEEIETMLEQNATIVLNTLNESSKANEPATVEDGFLDCETLSLVSNESESEKNLRIRLVNGLSRKLIVSSAQRMNSLPTSPQDEVRQIGEASSVGTREEQTGQTPSESDNESVNAEEQPRETKRPRIIKPVMARELSTDSNVTDKSEPESPKPIRGRRKALYSNPITRKSTPQSSPLKQPNPLVSGIPIGRSNTSPIVRATRAATLRQSTNAPSTAGNSPKTSTTGPRMTATAGPADPEKRTRNLSVPSKRASVPQKGSSLTFTKSVKRHSTPPTCSANFHADARPDQPAPKPLERQGTFTKDEPEVENAPTVPSATGSPIKTKIAKPVRGATSKVHPVLVPASAKPKVPVKTHPTKIAKANSSEKIQPPKGPSMMVAAKRQPGKPTATGKGAVTSQPENTRTFRKMGPLGQRSNSNSSIVSNTSAGVQTRKLAKEATSKIASLWKRVEESKSKQRFEKPDPAKQWIQPGAANSEVDTASSKAPAFRLFRSSTFEGVPQESAMDEEESVLYKSKSKRPLAVGLQANKMKYRNSCDLTGMNANDAPCKIPVNSSTYKRDDGGTVLLRNKPCEPSGNPSTDVTDPSKRISRLGSFIRVDPTTGEASSGLRTPASAIVPPFNYNPRQDIPSQTSNRGSPDEPGKLIVDCHHPGGIVTGSARVTTV